MVRRRQCELLFACDIDGVALLDRLLHGGLQVRGPLLRRLAAGDTAAKPSHITLLKLSGVTTSILKPMLSACLEMMSKGKFSSSGMARPSVLTGYAARR